MASFVSKTLAFGLVAASISVSAYLSAHAADAVGDTRKLQVRSQPVIEVDRDPELKNTAYWFTCTEARTPVNFFALVTATKPKDEPHYIRVKLVTPPVQDGKLARTDELNNQLKSCDRKVAQAVKNYHQAIYEEKDGRKFKAEAEHIKNQNMVRYVPSNKEAVMVNLDTGVTLKEEPTEEMGKEALKDDIGIGVRLRRERSGPVCLKDIDSGTVYTKDLSRRILDNWSERFEGSGPSAVGEEQFLYITAQEEGVYAKGAEICADAGKTVVRDEGMERIWPNMSGIPTKDRIIPNGSDAAGEECLGFEKNNLLGKVKAYGVKKTDYAQKNKKSTNRARGSDASAPLVRGYYCVYQYGSCGINAKVVACGSE